MNINLSVIAQIASTLGVLVAAASLLVGLRRFQMTRRHEYIVTLRKTIFDSRSSLSKVAETVWFSFDFVYEMTSGVADSKPLKVAIEEMYAKFFQQSVRAGDDPTEVAARAEGLKQYLSEGPQVGEFPTILVPVHGSLLEMCDNLITKMGGEMEPYRFEYPGLARVFLSVNRFFANFIASYKDYVRDSRVWREAITDVDLNYASTIDSPDELNGRLTEAVVARWYQEYITNNKDDEIVKKLLDIVDLVAKAYLSKTERELLEARNREKTEQFAPLEQATKITDNLNEAYKGLRWILADLDEQTYHDLVREIQQQTS